jgi:hypothetical protein
MGKYWETTAANRVGPLPKIGAPLYTPNSVVPGLDWNFPQQSEAIRNFHRDWFPLSWTPQFMRNSLFLLAVLVGLLQAQV